MQLLILGGTVFLGRALVDAALAAGHEVTLFNRGKSNPGLYPAVETLIGDRDGGLDVLAGRRWDVVVDTCGYVPRLVRDAAVRLADVVDLYVFISSQSVYADASVVDQDETAAVGTLDDESVEEITGETYGPLKALCERAATEAMHGRCLNVRSGLLVGPHDPSDRFTYWPVRVAHGGEVLAPVTPDLPVQLIDVRDMADWILRAAASGLAGTYNVTGLEPAVTLGDVLETARVVSGSDARFTWLSEAFLNAHEVAFWTELPLVIPGEAYAGFSTFNIDRALATGLTFRPLVETVRDTLAWAAERPSDRRWRAGLAPEREGELLAAWHAQQVA